MILERILSGKDVEPHHIGQEVTIPTVTRLPRSIGTATTQLSNEVRITIEGIDGTIRNLQATIDELRDRKEKLLFTEQLVDEFRGMAILERETWERIKSLGLVNIGMKSEVQELEPEKQE